MVENLNWIAVIAGTVVAFLVGWLWYGPKLFGQGWAEGSGVKLNTADKMPVFAMITQLAALLLLALVIGVTATTDALGTAILAILACATFAVSAGAFINKSRYALVVDAGYIVIAGIVMVIAQGLL